MVIGSKSQISPDDVARRGRPCVLFVLLLSSMGSLLQAGELNPQRKGTVSLQNDLKQTNARRDRLRAELSRLSISTHSENKRRGLSPDRLATAARRIRRLRHNLQELEAKISSLELERAIAINKLWPDAVSREEMCRLRCRDRIEKLLLETKRLEPTAKCPQTQSRLAEIELSIAQQRLRIAEVNVRETRRFPPGAISEQKFRTLLLEADAARMRVEYLRSLAAKSDPK